MWLFSPFSFMRPYVMTRTHKHTNTQTHKQTKYIENFCPYNMNYNHSASGNYPPKESFPKETQRGVPLVWVLSFTLVIDVFLIPYDPIKKNRFYCSGGRTYLVFVKYLLQILIWFFVFFSLCLEFWEKNIYMRKK